MLKICKLPAENPKLTLASTLCLLFIITHNYDYFRIERLNRNKEWRFDVLCSIITVLTAFY